MIVLAVINPKGRLRGVKLPHIKFTEDFASASVPIPEIIKIPMLQHMGAECVPLKKVGDTVLAGEKIGDSDKYMSVPIHSSVSGEIIAIDTFCHINGSRPKMLVIKPDGKQNVSPDVKPPEVSDFNGFINAVRESGAVGLGGAGFPTHIKLNYKDLSRIDTLVVNAAECEPYITSDYRTMIEKTDSILSGIKLLKEYLNIKYVRIAVESDKIPAIKLLAEKTGSEDGVDVVKLKNQYPQGAEKVIAYASTGRVIKNNMLPADAGIIVINVTTLAFLADYFKTGMPLVSKVVTIDGNAVKKPGNYSLLIGTPVEHILKYCETDMDNLSKILRGGLMMGIAENDITSPIVKHSNAVLAFLKDRAISESNCIRCGKCVRACPMRLMPRALEKAYDNKNIRELLDLNINSCMLCGSCSYVCPSKRNLAQKNQLAKAFVKNSEVK